MNSAERAAQIWCTPYMASKEMDVELCKLFAASIDEAVKEAEERTIKIGGIVAKDVYDKGFREGCEWMREEAAKVVCGVSLDYAWAAEKIHAIPVPERETPKPTCCDNPFPHKKPYECGWSNKLPPERA